MKLRILLPVLISLLAIGVFLVSQNSVSISICGQTTTPVEVGKEKKVELKNHKIKSGGCSDKLKDKFKI